MSRCQRRWDERGTSRCQRVVFARRTLREYLADELCQGEPPDGVWNLFAVEGGTAAICYIVDSLANNLLLRAGDRSALVVPEFTPYLDLPLLET